MVEIKKQEKGRNEGERYKKVTGKIKLIVIEQQNKEKRIKENNEKRREKGKND